MQHSANPSKRDFDELLQQALEKTRTYETELPGFQPLASVRRQLELMSQYVKAERTPPAEAQDSVNVGLLAVREFQDTDPQYSGWLIDLDYWFKRWTLLR